MVGQYVLGGDWIDILKDWHLDVLNGFADEFTPDFDMWKTALKTIFSEAEYQEVLGFIQYVLRYPVPPTNFANEIERALVASRAAYRVIDGDTIVPLASDTEGATFQGALEELRGTTFKGPRVHLKDAASAISAGEWAASVRESIHAVEAVVRLVGKSNSVDEALKKLANNGHINRNMSAGLVRLYAYTSDEKGIRHPLLEDGDANVDEADALYMLGASASFITYLVGKGRASGLLEE